MTVLDELLIPKFVQAYYAAQAAIDARDRAAATKAYQNLLATYKELVASSLAKPHKDLAHDQLTAIYAALKDLPANPEPARAIARPAAVVPPVAETPNPATAPTKQAQDINAELEQLDDEESEAAPVVVRAEEPRKGLLGPLDRKDFVALGFFTVLILLVLFFKPAYIGLAVSDTNAAPQWRGSETSFRVQAGTSLTLDLANSFTDPEGKDLVYLATESPGLHVTVTGSVVTVQVLPGAYGEHAIVLMASDLVSVTKVPITITVT